MNILNLPSPTGAQAIGEAVGTGLGYLAQAKLSQFQRNEAMKYLDASRPPSENVEGTTYQAPALYKQREQEQLLAKAPLYLRNQIQRLMQERNESALQERQLASNFTDVAEKTLRSIYEAATPDQIGRFRNRMLNYYDQGLTEDQALARIAADSKRLADSARAVEESIGSTRKKAFEKLARKVGGTYIPTDNLTKVLQAQVKPLIELGEIDLARKLLKNLDLAPSSIEQIVGQELGPEVLQEIKQSPAYETTTDELGQSMPKDQNNLKQLVSRILQINPQTNLVMLRKQLEEAKKADWNSYRDAIAELQNEGVIKLTPDQINQLAILKRPELDLAEKALETVSLENLSWKDVANVLKGLGSELEETKPEERQVPLMRLR